MNRGPLIHDEKKKNETFNKVPREYNYNPRLVKSSFRSETMGSAWQDQDEDVKLAKRASSLVRNYN